MATFAEQVEFLNVPQFDPSTNLRYSSGYVKVLEAGTSTLATVYSARDKGGTYTNPFALDADDTKEIYLDTGAYDFELYEGDPSSGGVKRDTISGMTYGLPDNDADDLFDGGYDKTIKTASIITKGPWADVRAFGATGDGVTDDTTAIQSALNGGASVVYFPAGTYVISSTLTVPSNVSIKGDGSGATFLDASAADNTAFTSNKIIVVGEGTLTALPALNVDPTYSGNTLEFVSDPGLSQDDVVVIFNPAQGSWSSFRTVYYAGEYARIATTSGNTVTLTETLVDGYSKSAVDVYKLTDASTCTVSGFTLIGNPSYPNAVRGLVLHRLVDSHVYDVKVRNTVYIGISAEKCYNLVIDSCSVNENYVNDAGGDYGINIGNSHIVQVKSCWTGANRHSVDLGGENDVGDVPCRYVNIIGNHISSIGGIQGLAFHGNNQFVNVVGNVIEGGVLLAGADSVIANNTFKGLADNNGNTFVYAAELYNANHTITGNTFTNPTTSAARALFIDFGSDHSPFSSDTSYGGNILISGNNFQSRSKTGDDFLNAIAVMNRGYTGDEAIDVVITGNSMWHSAEFDPEEFGSEENIFYAVDVRTYSGDYFGAVTVSGNKFIGGMRLRADNSDYAARVVAVKDNTFINGYQVFLQGALEVLEFKNNLVHRMRFNTSILGFDATKQTKIVHCSGNTINLVWGRGSSASTRGSMLFQYLDNAVVQDNFLGLDAKMVVLTAAAPSFTIGETITGGTSGATATVWGINGVNVLVGDSISGSFTNGETITGGTSGLTGTTAATPTPSTRNSGFYYSTITNLWRGNQVDLAAIGDTAASVSVDTPL